MLVRRTCPWGNAVLAACRCTLIIALAGCAADGGRAGTLPSNADEALLDWPFWPAGMRVHPASRLVIEQETSQAFIEARLEFTDALGDTSKAVGVMEFDLLVPALPSGASNPVLSWALPLNTLEGNAQHYDGITRTYLFRLSLGEWSISPDVTLIARFESIDGQRFSAEQRFR
jgi:hypothetical protein